MGVALSTLVCMGSTIEREAGVHGGAWGQVHGGYFSDPGVAAPLVDAVRNAIDTTAPATVVDLGGGAGHLLAMLREKLSRDSTSFVNVDDSKDQLQAATASGLACADMPISDLSRTDIPGHVETVLFIMRSVLHYFGEAGLAGILSHLRAQSRTGEYFIHQTASFSRGADADCLNKLYALMRSTKWYPTIDHLRSTLESTGWEVTNILPAPALRLSRDELTARYALSQDEVNAMARLPEEFDIGPDVFKSEPDDFCAFLHYRIYVCRAG